MSLAVARWQPCTSCLVRTTALVRAVDAARGGGFEVTLLQFYILRVAYGRCRPGLFDAPSPLSGDIRR